MEAPKKSSLVLSTPSEDFDSNLHQISYQDEASCSAAKAAHASAAFGFPFNPYSIQIDLMRAVFRCIEDGKVGIFESPTGTGKSLSLICAAFTWLRANSERAQKGEMAQDSDEPDWVVAHDQQRRRAELNAHENELKERIRKVREREAKLRSESKRNERESLVQDRKKRAKRQASDSDESDSEFLASDFDSSDEGPNKNRSKLRSTRDDDDEYSNLSPAVRALMAELDANRKSNSRNTEEEEPETNPKIFYVSRTHSQLSQFVSELRKTKFGQQVKVKHLDENGTRRENEMELESEPIRTVSLGSRRQMCINDSVQKIGKRGGTEAMNERCRELAKGGEYDKRHPLPSKGEKRCEFLAAQNNIEGQTQLLDFRDRTFTRVHDIEDLVELGQELHVCPYFGSRKSARQAELVTLPYNLLLHKNTRESLNISLTGSVVIIDEAHNLIDTILGAHTVTTTSEQISQAIRQIDVYLARFRDRLKGSNEMHLRQVRATLVGLEKLCLNWSESKRTKDGKSFQVEELMTASQVVEKMGGNLDTINLLNLERYLRESQIARKVSGYADRKAAKSEETSGGGKASSRSRSNAAITAMHTIEAFILSLGHRSEDGRVLLSMQPRPSPPSQMHTQPQLQLQPQARPKNQPVKNKGQMREKTEISVITPQQPVVTLKYQLLNPSNAFKDLTDEARAIVLAGGTMEPMSDFRTQLMPSLEPERFATLSCGHVIPPSNLLATVVSSGPRNTPFEFKFDSRNNLDLMDDLGNAIVNFCNQVPDGIVVFLPSYTFLDALHSRWNEKGTTRRIGTKKKIFLEPKSAQDVDAVLRDYTLAIDAPEEDAPAGAILLAVVGAKLSEGINFSDELARAVVMVGMPFPNSQSPELAERMRYVRELARKNSNSNSSVDPGNELYINICMKAVNQSIGRAIRHQNDYAALILLDRRYARPEIKARLPGWIRNQVETPERFGGTISALSAFFKTKT